VDFSKRLSRVAAIATWGGIVLALVGAVVLHQRHDTGVHLHFVPFLAWQGLAVVNALALTALPTLHGLSAHVRRRITTYRVLLLLSIMVAITGAASVSGGIRGPFWVLYLPNVLFAASTMRQWQSVLLGMVAGAGVVGSSAIAHTLDMSTAAWFVLVVPVYPAIAWFNGTLASSVWAMRSHAKQERDELQARVAELSRELAKAAEGDLTVQLGDPDGDHAALELLTGATAYAGAVRARLGARRSSARPPQQVAGNAGAAQPTVAPEVFGQPKRSCRTCAECRCSTTIRAVHKCYARRRAFRFAAAAL